jgi:tRNA dimethylallyltransferase
VPTEPAPEARRCLALVGPTASGKSELALRLAADLPVEIVSCDSLQVYRGFDIGSAKPTADERRRVPHHLLDVVGPGEQFSAADYGRLARTALEAVAAAGRMPVVVGGTGLYLKALLEGLFEGPGRDTALRERLHGLAARFGDARLHRYLSRVDAETAAHVAVRDRVRVVRALEVYHLTRRPLSAHHRAGRPALAGFTLCLVGLDLPRDELARRVASRTEALFQRGLLDEVRGLLAAGVPPEARPLRAIGYRQALAVAQGRLGLAEARRDIVQATLRYAKRQRTWFRHQAQVEWFSDPAQAEAAARAFLAGPIHRPSQPLHGA